MAYEKLVSDNAESFEDGLDELLSALEDSDMAHPLDTVSITIVQRTTGRISPNGKQIVNSIAFIDAPLDQVLTELHVEGI